jgi:hypothetical protein
VEDPFKLLALYTRAGEEWRPLPKVESDFLQSVASAFVSNIDRVNELATLPIKMHMQCMVDLTAVYTGESLYDAHGEGESTITKDDKIAFAQRLITESVLAPENYRKSLENAVHKITQYDTVSNHVGFGSWLASLIVGMWTAYEVLATDLWVEAVNHRPKSLGKNAWAGRKAKGGSDDREGERKRDFSSDLLDEYDFDLSKSLGTMMCRKRHYDFNSLVGLQQAYKEAFRIQGKKEGQTGPYPEVKNWFSGSRCESVAILEAIRHAVVHRGGKADAAFLSRVEHDPVFGKLSPQDMIPLDGEVLDRCLFGVVEQGNVLLTGVDQWLTNNPK